jgi:hypothetical protein
MKEIVSRKVRARRGSENVVFIANFVEYLHSVIYNFKKKYNL